MLSPEHVDRLGGIATIRRSSAYFSVEEVPSGAVALQATELLSA